MRKVLFALFLAITTVCNVMAQKSIYLHVEQPGTLGELIGEFKYKITSLKLSGKLNGTDIAFIRDMCGRRQEWRQEHKVFYIYESEGILQKLDLSGADIVAGGEYVAVITTGMVDPEIGEMVYTNAGFNTDNNIISGGMFRDLETLRTVILPNSAVSIQEAVFQDAKNLKSVTIGENVKEIGAYVFGDCESLVELNVKNPTPPMGFDYGSIIGADQVFGEFDTDNCQLTVPKGTREAYKESELWRCFFDIRTVLETIFVDDGIPADNVVCSLPGKLDRIIGARRYNLESIKLSGYMDANDIAVLRDMMGIVVDKEGNITRTDGRLTEIDMSEVEFVAGEDSYNYAIEDGFSIPGLIINDVVLPPGMFAGCDRLKSVVLPSSISVISNEAFYGCTSLEISPIEDNIELIDMNAFAGCSSLREIRLSQNLTAIGDRAFFGCPLERVIIPDKVQRIGNEAFCSDTEISELAIGNSVEQIGENAFGKCANLSDIYVWATVPPSLGIDGKKYGYDENNDGDITFFQSIDFENCRLVIPEGTYTAYSSAPIWSRFKNIKETSSTGVETLNIAEDDNDALPREIYDINGIRRTDIGSGLNIIRFNNGKVKKIMNGNR